MPAHIVPLDSTWATTSFFVSRKAMSDAFAKKQIYKSSADVKFTSTRVGGNFAINPLYQYTQYCDVPTKGRLQGRNDLTVPGDMGNYGMGDYYSEAIDDTAQLIYLRFGVPQYTSLLSFLSNSYDLDMGYLVANGTARSAFYKLVEAAFMIVPIAAAPLFSGAVLFTRGVNARFTKPSSKFWTLKPTMHLYWSTVNTLINSIAVNMGIFPRFMFPDTKNDPQSQKSHIDKEMLDHLHQLMPDVFTKNYGIDAFAIACKAQASANTKQLQEFDRLKNGTAADMQAYISKIGTPDIADEPPGKLTLYDFIKTYIKGSYWINDTPPQATEDAQSFSGHVATDPNIDPKTGHAYERPPEKPNIISYLDAEFAMGSQFACFRVETTGSVQESFSNEIGESAFASKINSAVSGVREIKFGLADGNVIGGNVLGDAINSVGSFIKNNAESALSGVTLGFSNVISQMFAGAFMDINKTWKASSSQLPRSTYAIELYSPYNHPISRLMDIYLPLSMLLAGCLPRSSGKRSYNHPFYCMLFDRGRNMISEGMIEQVTITRGTTNLPFTKTAQALGIRVEFTIVDTSSIMHAPISSGGLFGGSTAIDEDTVMFNYLAMITGQDLASQITAIAKAKLNLAKRVKTAGKIFSPAYLASYMHTETTTGFLGTIATLGLGRAVSALSPTPEIASR